jgi:hypothetical protein
MDDINGSEGTGVEQAVQVDGRQFLKPDSVLVRAALDLLSTHVVDAEGESTLCTHCGLSYPCPTAQHARQVANAGGLASMDSESSESVDTGDSGGVAAEPDVVVLEVRDPVAAI